MLDLLALGLFSVPAVGSLAHRLWVKRFGSRANAPATESLLHDPEGHSPETSEPPASAAEPASKPQPTKTAEATPEVTVPQPTKTAEATAEVTPPIVPVPHLPPGWERWGGARPEPRGWPADTILAVRGLHTTSPEFRKGLLDLSAGLGIPVDSLATIMSSESGFNPAALNPLPAAGLIQLTVGAHLDGFGNAELVRAVTKLSAVDQLPIVRAYYVKMGPRAQGADPGLIYMLNFLPVHAGKPEAYVLGRKDAPGFEGKVYELNRGFDRQGKGAITIGDVFTAAAAIGRAAHGKRLDVLGNLLDGAPQVVAPEVKIAPRNQHHGNKDSAKGLLLAAVTAGKFDPITWIDVTVGPLIVTVAADAIKASIGDHERVRLPVSYREMVQVCKILGCVAPTQGIADAVYAAAKVHPVPVPLDPGDEMASIGYSIMHSENVDKFITSPSFDLVADVGKDWIIHPRIVELGAVNYGWRLPGGKPLQGVGGKHNEDHFDYSQVCRPVKRAAKMLNGQPVDLIDLMLKETKIPQTYLEVYR